ncbi:hypothetical protein RR46_12773 [Papilio xuthus]|uniref:Uncharacterized protein n=1 Tax=Papilio xuthus TaxID=66420 RepID=A0A194PUT1_PAPXU|nr:hypothetical protein RR46_12773 [Papilio xuthus]
MGTMNASGDRKQPKAARAEWPARELPSRWYTLLALPFPDQQVGRREKHNHGKRYRHHVSPDCNTVASLDSSSSESRSGLNRYYRQAWEELHEAAGAKHGHRRHEREAPKDGSELVVADVCPAPHSRDKRRHHHHHRRDWAPSNRTHHNHKPRH